MNSAHTRNAALYFHLNTGKNTANILKYLPLITSIIIYDMERVGENGETQQGNWLEIVERERNEREVRTERTKPDTTVTMATSPLTTGVLSG